MDHASTARRTTYLPHGTSADQPSSGDRLRRMGNPPPAEGTTTIVIADDHGVVRSGLRMLLEAEPDLEVVAEAGDVEDARRFVRGHKPAVLILDLNMPGEPSL